MSAEGYVIQKMKEVRFFGIANQKTRMRHVDVHEQSTRPTEDALHLRQKLISKHVLRCLMLSIALSSFVFHATLKNT